MPLHGGLRNHPFTDHWDQPGQQRGAEDHPGENLADHGRLTESLGEFTEETRRRQEHRDLDDELEDLVV